MLPCNLGYQWGEICCGLSRKDSDERNRCCWRSFPSLHLPLPFSFFWTCKWCLQLHDHEVASMKIKVSMVRVAECGCCLSVAQSCPILWDPMNGSMPVFPVLHYLPEFAQTHVHWVGDAIYSSHPLQLPLPLCLQSFPASGSFPMSQLSVPGGQSIGASARAAVLSMNIQGWFPLGVIGLISLLSRGLSRVFSSARVWKHQFFGSQPSL